MASKVGPRKTPSNPKAITPSQVEKNRITAHKRAERKGRSTTKHPTTKTAIRAMTVNRSIRFSLRTCLQITTVSIELEAVTFGNNRLIQKKLFNKNINYI